VTDECRPAAGAADNTHHWLRSNANGHFHVAMWAWGGWYWCGGGVGETPAEAAHDNTYHLPASPDDAEARERLEREATIMRNEIARTAAIADHLMDKNKRLREALEFIAKSEVAVTMPWTHEIAADAFSAALHRNRSAAKEALNAR